MDGTRARALLGVSAHATPDELRRAFRRCVLATHPDRGGNAARFDETVVAFRSLASLRAVAPVDVTAHVPFDRYDMVAPSPHRRVTRPSFADVLARVSATPIAA